MLAGAVVRDLLPLALLSAITSPTAIAAVLVILTRPRAFTLLAAYVIGSIAASMAVGLLIVTLLSAAGTFTPKAKSANPALDITMGVFILLSTAYLVSDRSARLRRTAARKRAERKARKAAQDKPPSRTSRVLTQGSVSAVAVLGVAMHMPGLLYLVALADMAHENLEFVELMLVLLVFNLVMLLPIELPLISYAFKPDWTRATLKRIDDYARANDRKLLVGGALIAGGYLIANGLYFLLSR